MARLAYAYECDGALEEARDWYRRAVGICPSKAGIHARLGILALKHNEFDSARPHLKRAIELDPDLAEAHWGLAMVAVHEPDLDTALIHAQKAVEEAPDRSEYLTYLAYVQELSGDHVAAEQTYRQVVGLFPQSYPAWTSLGWYDLDRSDWDSALEEFSTAVEGMPTLADGHWGRAEALNMLGRSVEAQTAIERALDLDPSNADYYECQGRILIVLSSLPEAEKALRTALLFDPESARVECNLGHAIASQSRMEEAGLHFRRAVDLEPGESGYWSALGEYLEEVGSYPEAEHAFRKAIELEPSYERYYWLLARLLLFLGRSEEAASSLLSADLDHLPYELQAIAAASRGDLETARVHAEAAERDATEEYEAVTLGPMWELVGDKKKARSHYEEGSRNGDRFARELLMTVA
jgi:Flp pilus assembly protein TadD